MVVAVAAAAAVAVVVALVEAMVPLRMILCLQIVRFPCFLKRRNGQTDGPTNGPTDLRTDLRTYGRTDPLREMRGRILKSQSMPGDPSGRAGKKNQSVDPNVKTQKKERLSLSLSLGYH